MLGNITIPDWLTRAAGAQNFANNPANGFAPTLGDALQGIGHSMAQHYRGKGGTYGGPVPIPGVTGKVNNPIDMPQVLPAAPMSKIEGSPLGPFTQPMTQPMVSPQFFGPQGGKQPWGALSPFSDFAR